MTNTDFPALCHEFTDALTEVLAENAVGLARRGRHWVPLPVIQTCRGNMPTT